MNQAFSRRNLLRAGAAGAAMGMASPALCAEGKAPPSQRVRLGVIGCGRRGQQLISVFQTFDDVEIAVLCDVYGKNLDEGHQRLGGKPDRERDYRKILERKDIDAVVVATPEHWHGLPFIHACQAGKHVYVEKPLSHTIVEGRAMVKAAKKAGVVAMMGTQQHGQPHYGRAVQIVQSGRLGAVSLVECWNVLKFGKKWTTPVIKGQPPADLDWERWLGPEPLVEFDIRRLRGSPFWFTYGGGFMTEWGPHHIDIILWAMKVDAPGRACCMGGQYIVQDEWDTPDNFQASWAFPNFLMHFCLRGQSKFPARLSRPSDHGIAFYGDQATLLIDRAGYDLYVEKDLRRPAESAPPTPQDGPWHRTFIDCVKEKRQPQVDIEHSHKATVCAHLGNIAYRTGRTIRWDGRAESIPGDEEAAAMLSRPRRRGYELPEV